MLHCLHLVSAALMLFCHLSNAQNEGTYGSVVWDVHSNKFLFTADVYDSFAGVAFGTVFAPEKQSGKPASLTVHFSADPLIPSFIKVCSL